MELVPVVGQVPQHGVFGAVLGQPLFSSSDKCDGVSGELIGADHPDNPDPWFLGVRYYAGYTSDRTIVSEERNGVITSENRERDIHNTVSQSLDLDPILPAYVVDHGERIRDGGFTGVGHLISAIPRLL